MDIKNESISNVCSLIHSISKLNIEFIDTSRNSMLRLFNLKILHIIEPSRKQTALFIENFLRGKSHNNFLYYTDSFNLSYLGVGLLQGNDYKGTIIAGPFLSDFPDDSFISNITSNNNLPLAHRQLLLQYYKGLNILPLNDYKNIGTMMVNFTINPFIYANILIPKNEKIIASTKEENDVEKEKLHSQIELNYNVQKELENAVKKGLKDEAIKVLNLLHFNPAHRVPNNPLRASKNLAFSLSSMLRTAAQNGGVSPIYLHNISDMFAVLIEKVSTISELESLIIKMVSDHCDLVKTHSTTGYSPKISKAINHINLNFDSAVSLSSVADIVDVSPSHLSRQFKKETGLTITEFINKKRVEESKFLIKQNNNSLIDIALMVGFTNHSYFCTVFKQITNLTPTEYLNKKAEHKNR